MNTYTHTNTHTNTKNTFLLNFTKNTHISLNQKVEIDEPVGPNNPLKVLDDYWSACWDEQASAVYYYNNISGEATWLHPFES